MIQIQAQIIDRHLRGLIGLGRAELRGDSIMQVVAPQGGGLRGLGAREIHQFGFHRRLIARRHFARRRLIHAALRRIQREIQT